MKYKWGRTRGCLGGKKQARLEDPHTYEGMGEKLTCRKNLTLLKPTLRVQRTIFTSAFDDCSTTELVSSALF